MSSCEHDFEDTAYHSDLEKSEDQNSKHRNNIKPDMCQSVFGCSNTAWAQADNGVWLCLPCFSLDDKFG